LFKKKERVRKTRPKEKEDSDIISGVLVEYVAFEQGDMAKACLGAILMARFSSPYGGVSLQSLRPFQKRKESN